MEKEASADEQHSMEKTEDERVEDWESDTEERDEEKEHQKVRDKKAERREKARERREKRRQEVSLLRTIPYSDHQRWWSADTIAVVTGANRGIGFEIARQLAMHGVTVILTSRDAAVGEEAAKVLQEGGLNVHFHQLDIVNDSSITSCNEWLMQNFGGIDILVNNAGVSFNYGPDNQLEHADQVIATNYFGTKKIIEAMIPLMRPSTPGARIINVSSRLGRLNGRRNRIGDVALRRQLEDVDLLSEELIDRTMATFLEQVKGGNLVSGMWPQTATDYALSKLAVNAYTRVKAKEFSDRPVGEKIYINCYCPGWVRTAMTGWAGHTSPEEGADTGVWLALLPTNQVVTGKFFAERREINY
ncbi:Carbonyl reductase (NADPH) [Bertholletia excelsa]